MAKWARVKTAGSLGSIRMPVRPSSINSGKPPTRVATMGQPGNRGFQDGLRHPLGATRQGEAIHDIEEFPGLLLMTDEMDARLQVELADQVKEFILERPVPHDDEMSAGDRPPELRE